MAEKKSKSLVDDFADTFKGVGNVISGKIFDPKSWSAESLETEQKVTKSNDDGGEEIEEVRTVKRSKRGTFSAAPAKGGAEGGNPGSPGGGQPGKKDGEPGPATGQ